MMTQLESLLKKEEIRGKDAKIISSVRKFDCKHLSNIPVFTLTLATVVSMIQTIRD